MAKRDECHDLIRTLSAREKAYFQRFAKRHSDRDIPDYLRLFRVLDAMPVYDEQALRRRLKGSPLLSRLSSAKRYLYRQLLKALDLYYTGEEKDPVWPPKPERIAVVHLSAAS